MKGVKRLVQGFRPESYQLELSPDRDKMFFEGRVIISGKKSGRPSHRITLHQNGLKIKKVEIKYFDKKKGELNVEIKRINLLQAVHEVRLHTAELLYPGNYELHLSFSGKINEQMHGMYACNYNHDGKPKKIISTQFESHHAREVFPCIDEPAAKAVFEMTLKTPDETVISNTPIVTQEKLDELMVTKFAPTPKMSTYLLAFVYGDLRFEESSTKNEVKIRSYATPNNSHLLSFSVDTAVRAVEFFENYFGIEYPLPKLDMVSVPDFAEGAMENWGLITYRESCMLVDEETTNIDTRQFAALIICHEIAHQWFGNLVTMEWWDDLWLNESFANLMEYRAVDELFPQWNIWEHFVNSELGSALRRDCLPNVQPVKTDVRHPDEISTLFDPAIVYAKGGSLLHMLMHRLGEDRFKAGLTDYFNDHRYGNTEADDLWNALSKYSDQDIRQFMQPWLSRPGYPVVSISQVSDNHYRLKQERLVMSPHDTVVSEPWPVPLAISAPANTDLLAVKETDIKINVDVSDALFFNRGAKSFYVAEYKDVKLFDAILRFIEAGNLPAVDRLILLQSYSLLERANRVSTTDNLKALQAYGKEREEPVWNAMAAVMNTSRRLVFDTEAEPIMKRYQAELVAPLIDYVGWDRGTGDDSQTLRLREHALGLGASAEMPEIIRQGLQRFANIGSAGDIASDIRNPVYFIGARFGDSDDFEKLLSMYKKTDNADEKDELCSALTSTKDKNQIHHLISMLKSPEVRLQDLPNWFAHLIGNVYAKDLAWEWLTKNWAWIEKKYDGSGSLDKYPRYAAFAFSRQADLRRYIDFFEPLKENVALERAIQLGIEEITGRVAWRAKNEKNTIDWLKDWQKKN